MVSENASIASTETVSEHGRLQDTEENHQLSKDSEEEDRSFPGVTYPLNSKRLVVRQLMRLATMLESPCKGTVAVLRQVVEGKLVKLGYKPSSYCSELRFQTILSE